MRQSRTNLGIFDGIRGGYGRKPARRGGGMRYSALLIVLAVVLFAAAVWVLYRRLNPDLAADFGVVGVEDTPVAGALIEGELGNATTDEEGFAVLDIEPPSDIVVSAPGYQSGTFTVEAVPEDAVLYLQLEPVILTGRVTNPDGGAIGEATVRLGNRETTTSDLGIFEIAAAAPGTVEVDKIAWETATVDWDGSTGRLDITLEPFLVHGLRVYFQVAEDPNRLDALLDMAEGTAINALLFDVKDEWGAVMYDTQVQEAIDIEAANIYGYDVETALQMAKERGFYTIARIATFQDSFWPKAHPEHGVMDTETGELWQDIRGNTWMDPTDHESWQYPISLALEACELGFDEINFDYVRFPVDGDLTVAQYDLDIDYTPQYQTERVDVIAGFLKEARSQLHDAGCVLSADIYAIVLSVDDDQGVGQKVEELSYAVDALSPMIYPDHYWSGWLGYDCPWQYPGEIVNQALESGLPRMAGSAQLRPLLQAHSSEKWPCGLVEYGPEEIQAEIDQADERGLGWILWHPISAFEADWFPPASAYED